MNEPAASSTAGTDHGSGDAVSSLEHGSHDAVASLEHGSVGSVFPLQVVKLICGNSMQDAGDVLCASPFATLVMNWETAGMRLALVSIKG